MNRVILACSVIVLAVLGCVLTFGKSSRVVYVPGKTLMSAPTIPYVDCPNGDQVKKDLSGKVIKIDGKNHQFAGPELNEVTVLSSQPIDVTNMTVDVRLCADATVVEKKGAFRTAFAHENVCGVVRIYYAQEGGKWVYKNAESIDLHKVLKPNTKAPPVIVR